MRRASARKKRWSRCAEFTLHSIMRQGWSDNRIIEAPPGAADLEAKMDERTNGAAGVESSQNAPPGASPETTENHMEMTGNHNADRIGDVHNQGNLRRDVARYGNGTKCPLLTIKGLGYRSPAYRETKRLIREIEADLGGAEQLSAAERQTIQHAAVLGAIAQDIEAKYLLGRHVDLVVLCRILNAQNRAFGAIGYRRRQRDVTSTLDGYLAKLEKTEHS